MQYLSLVSTAVIVLASCHTNTQHGPNSAPNKTAPASASALQSAAQLQPNNDITATKKASYGQKDAHARTAQKSHPNTDCMSEQNSDLSAMLGKSRDTDNKDMSQTDAVGNTAAIDAPPVPSAKKLKQQPPPCIHSFKQLLAHTPPANLNGSLGIQFEQLDYDHYKVRREFQRWFSCRTQKSIHRALLRGEQYFFPQIERAAQKYSPEFIDAGSDTLPLIAAIEAKLVTESLVSVNAISWAGAAGPWQFMRSTFVRYLKRFELKDPYPLIDLRFDWDIATRAALKLNADNFKSFAYTKSPLSCGLMAYNAGVHRVAQALRRQRTNDCRRLRYSRYTHRAYIKTETYRYHPRIMLITLYRHWRKLHGYTKQAAAPNTITTVQGNGPIDIQLLEQEMGLEKTALIALNRQYPMGITPTGDWELNVHSELAEHCQTSLQDLKRLSNKKVAYLLKRAKPLELASLLGKDAFRYYRIRRGDTVSQICRRFGISMWKLFNLNKRLFLRNRRRTGRKWSIFPGQRLRLPALHQLVNRF